MGILLAIFGLLFCGVIALMHFSITAGVIGLGVLIALGYTAKIWLDL